MLPPDNSGIINKLVLLNWKLTFPPGHLVWKCESHSVMSYSLWPHGLFSPWNSPGQNTGVGSLSLLQGIFLTQGSNPGLLHCRQILYQLSHKGSPRILEWVAYPFSSGSSRPRNWTGVSWIAGRFFPTELSGKWSSWAPHTLVGWPKPSFPQDSCPSCFFLYCFAVALHWWLLAIGILRGNLVKSLGADRILLTAISVSNLISAW